MSNFCQQPQEQIHTLNTRITTLVNSCRFQDQQTTETIKIMLLQHEVKFHEARDWIRLQDPSTLTYQSLLKHCKLFEQCCKQYQIAQLKGRGQLTSLGMAISTHSSVHQDYITSHHQATCHRCGHNHPEEKCLAFNQ